MRSRSFGNPGNAHLHDGQQRPPDSDSLPGAVKPGQQRETTLHPFIEAFTRIGAKMGQDIGVMALRACQAQRGVGAVLWWDGEHIPESVQLLLPEGTKGVANVAILPAGIAIPEWWRNQDVDGQVIQKACADGSTLLVMLKPVESPGHSAPDIIRHM